MFFYEDLICPVCDKKFVPDDDVVSCPKCGAPHHRSCWQKAGDCSLKDFHGTKNQWTREKALEQTRAYEDKGEIDDKKVCPNCHAENYEFSEFCFKCGRDLIHDDWNSVPFHHPHTIPKSENFESGYVENNSAHMGGYGEYAPFTNIFDLLGGVHKDEQISGISAEEIASYVGSNTAYYLPRFVRLDREKSNVSWNWAAFLFTPYWLFFRKNTLAGALVFLFNLISVLFSNYFTQIYILPHVEEGTFNEIYNYIASSDSFNGFLLAIFLFNITTFLISLVFGLYANSLYLSKVKKEVGAIRSRHYGKNQIINIIKPEYRNELITSGGVSFAPVGIAIGAHYFISFIFTVFMQNLNL